MADEIDLVEYKLYDMFNSKDVMFTQLKNKMTPIIEKVEQYLDEPFPRAGHLKELTLLQIKKLGFHKIEEPLELEKQKFHNMQQTVYAIANNSSQFEVILEMRNGVGALLYGVQEEETDTLEAACRAFYKSAAIVPIDQKPAVLSKQWCAKATLPDRKNQEDGGIEKSFSEYSNWIDAAAQLVRLKDFCIKFHFDKVDVESLERRMGDLYQLLEKLIAAKKNNMQTSTQESTSKTKGKLKAPIYQQANLSESDTVSYSLSFEHEITKISYLMPKIEHEMHRLQEAMKSAAWNVRLSISAKESEEAHIIMGILSGVMGCEKLHLSWQEVNHKFIDHDTLWLTQREIYKMAQLPEKDFVGFSYEELEDYSISATEKTEICLGNIMNNDEILEQKLYVDKSDFNRHAFVCGMTGAGKTNTLFYLLHTVDIPYLVIEPVKSEYRKLQKMGKHINVWTMESKSASALKINPFWFPEHTSLQYHMDGLKNIIASAFSLYAAMPNILEQCIYNIYLKCGWNLTTGENIYAGQIEEEYLYPTFMDLYLEVESYLEESEYEGETLSTYKGALSTRLKSFTTGTKGILLNTTAHPDYERWLKEAIVIELEDLSDDSDKAVVMGAILIQYYQYLKYQHRQEEKQSSEALSHLIVIEEAHRLFKNIANQQSNPEIANSEGQLIELLTNMMAEIRAYGEGIVIVDQSPSKIALDVIKNSNIKIVHRLDSKDDIELIEGSLLLKESDKSFTLLKQGEALIRSEGFKKPVKIKVPFSKKQKVEQGDHPQDNQISSIENNKGIIVTDGWKRNPIVDVVLGNERFCKDLSQLIDRLVNNLLYDSFSNINQVVHTSTQLLDKLLAQYGYGTKIIQMDTKAYCNLFIAGMKSYMRKHLIYKNHYKFNSLLLMMFERILRLAQHQDITQKEAVIFEKFRNDTLYDLLTEMLTCQGDIGSQLSEINDICGYNTVQSYLIYQYLVLFEAEKLEAKEVLKESGVQELTNKWLAKFFVVRPMAPVVYTLSFNFEKVLKAITNER